MKLVINTDGGARNNPGPAGAGAVITDKAGTLIGEVSEFLGSQTNNWAEYQAVILALQKVVELKLGLADIDFKLDSKLVVEQLSGNWKIKDAALAKQAARVREFLANKNVFGRVIFSYIPREQNGHADMLANRAMDRGTSR